MTGNPAPNAVLRPVVDYAPDPNGWAFANGLQRRISATLNGARKVVPRSGTWHGWTQDVQNFRGRAGSAVGSARPIAPRSSTMQDQTTGQTVASQIWSDRARRGL